MDTESVARPARKSTDRIRRGRELYREHREGIEFVPATRIWVVPSANGSEAGHYLVSLKPERCECRDFEFRGLPCKHVVAATIAHAKTAPCSGCFKRFRGRDLTEITEDHESLTWFIGDLLCEGCIRDHGGIS